MNLKKSVNQKNNTRLRLLGARGFTLVEILITMSIVTVLIGLSVSFAYMAKIWAAERATMTAIGFLHNASLRYNQTIPIPLSDKDAATYAVNTGSGLRPMTSMEYFLYRTAEIPDCVDQLQHLPKELYVAVVPNNDGSPTTFNIVLAADPSSVVKNAYPLKTVKDANGIELKYCARASAADPVTVPPFDAAMPYAEFPYFASAGRDKSWGTLADHDAGRPDAEAKDNVYSFTEHQ